VERENKGEKELTWKKGRSKVKTEIGGEGVGYGRGGGTGKDILGRGGRGGGG
jgi:hypothetical protein